MSNETEIQVPVWYKNGGMWIRRDSLEPDHPESTFNYIKNVLNKNPEDYGYYCTQLTEEQQKLLSTIPTDALFRECRLREQAIMNLEMYGDW